MKRTVRTLIALLLCMVMLLSACEPAAEQPAGAAAASSDAAPAPATQETSNSTAPKILTMALSTAWDTMCTLNTTSAYSDTVFDFIYDRLVVIHYDGTFSSRLAESWEVSPENDKLTMKLNKNATWHDGEPVTADDVVFTFQTVANENAGHIRSNRAVYFAGTNDEGKCAPEDLGVKALDEHTVEFTFKTPMDVSPILAVAFRDIFIIPEHIYGKLPIETLHNAEEWNTPIGSGPCKFESQIAGDRIELVANKDYYLGTPDFDRFVLKVVPASNFLTGLMSGDIDVVGTMSSIPLNDWDAAQQAEGLVAQPGPRFNYKYFAINTERIPLEVRQAINLSIDREAIVKGLLKGTGQPLMGPLASTHLYYNENIPMQYDPEKAIQMIKDSGFDTSKELVFLVGSGDDLREKTCMLVEQYLEAIGLNIRIQLMDFAALLATCREGDYDLAYIGSAGALDPDESVSLFTVGSNVNFSHISDPRLGELGAEGARGLTFEARKPIYDQYFELLYELAPSIFLYSDYSLYCYNARISNVHTDDWFVNPCVWEWKVS